MVRGGRRLPALAVRRSAWSTVMVAVLGAAIPSGARAQAPEAEVKAAYLYNFGRYVEWPKEPPIGKGDNFSIGVLGKSAVEPFLEKIALSKQVQGKAIVVYHFASVAEYKPCHILFVAAPQEGDNGGSAEERIAQAAKKTKGSPVLMVSETDGMAEKGAIINFVIDDNRVKFEINSDAAREARLQISSKLLRVGKIVSSAGK